MPPAATGNDEQLMLRVQADETAAFAQLYDRHSGRAFGLAHSVCRDRGRAEEVVQDGFLTIWRRRTSYQPEAGSFLGWAMAIVRNRAIDSVRRDAAARRPQLAETEYGGADPSSVPPQDAVIAASEGAGLRDLLSRIPPAQAEVIALAYFGELTHTEIASRLAVPEGTVKGRLRLGLEKLRAQMEAG